MPGHETTSHEKNLGIFMSGVGRYLKEERDIVISLNQHKLNPSGEKKVVKKELDFPDKTYKKNIKTKALH